MTLVPILTMHHLNFKKRKREIQNQLTQSFAPNGLVFEEVKEKDIRTSIASQTDTTNSQDFLNESQILIEDESDLSKSQNIEVEETQGTYEFGNFILMNNNALDYDDQTRGF